MASSPTSQPTLDSIAPRFVCQDLEQALVFYGQLGFVTTYQDEAFAIGSFSVTMTSGGRPKKRLYHASAES
jgi:hypothetical protein